MKHTDARRAAQLRTITLADLLAHPFPPRFHLVEPWLRDGESCLLWAAPGIGKSWLALTVAALVAGGGEALGWRSPEPRPVLYVDGEMHTADLRDRMRDLLPAIGGLDAEAAGRNLHFFPRQFQDADARFPDLAETEGATRGALRHPAGQEVVLAKAREVGARLIVCDNLATLADVADENDAAAMTPVLGFLLTLKQAGIAALVVHHSGKSGETYRGSSRLATTFEAIVGLKPLKRDGNRDGAGFEMEWTKVRAQRSAATRPAEVILEGAGEGLRWTVRPSANAEVEAVVEAVRSGRYGTQKALAEALGMHPSKVSRLKDRADALGIMPARQFDKLLESGGDAWGDEAGQAEGGEEHSDF